MGLAFSAVGGGRRSGGSGLDSRVFCGLLFVFVVVVCLFCCCCFWGVNSMDG